MELGVIGRRLDRLHVALIFLTILSGVILLNMITKSSSYQPYIQFHISSDSQTNHQEKTNLEAKGRLVRYEKSTPLLWIGGVPRSGTTLMRVMLDAHPDIRCGEETRVVPRILGKTQKWLSQQHEREHKEKVGISESLAWSATASYILTIIEGHGDSAPLLCDKDPFSLSFLPNILDMFPASKFILMIRDGRAVTHSIVSRKVQITNFDWKTYNGSLKDWNKILSSMYSRCMKAGEDRCLPVYYERLILDPRLQMERILNFVGVSWDDAVLHHEMSIGQQGGISLSKVELSTDQVNNAISQDALNKWGENFPSDVLQEVNEYAPLLKQLGYRTNIIPMNYSTDLNPILEQGFVNFVTRNKQSVV